MPPCLLNKVFICLILCWNAVFSLMSGIFSVSSVVRVTKWLIRCFVIFSPLKIAHRQFLNPVSFRVNSRSCGSISLACCLPVRWEMDLTSCHLDAATSSSLVEAVWRGRSSLKMMWLFGFITRWNSASALVRRHGVELMSASVRVEIIRSIVSDSISGMLDRSALMKVTYFSSPCVFRSFSASSNACGSMSTLIILPLCSCWWILLAISDVVSPKPVPASNIVFPSSSMFCQKYASNGSDVSSRTIVSHLS